MLQYLSFMLLPSLVIPCAHRFLYRSIAEPADNSSELPLPVSTEAARRNVPSSTARVLLVKVACDLSLLSSLVIAQLVLCEIGNWIDPVVRISMWHVVTSITILLQIVLIPLLQIYNTVSTKRSLTSILSRRSYRVSLTGLLFACWLLAFYKAGTFLPSRSLAATSADRTYSEMILVRVAFIGITAMAILSGFGAVSAVYEVFVSRSRQPDESDVARIQRAIDSTLDLQSQLATKKVSLPRSSSLTSKPGSTTNLVFKMLSNMQSVQTEDNAEFMALERMKNELQSELTYTKKKIENRKWRQSLLGRFYRIANVVFASYCIYRLFTVFVLRNPISRVSILTEMPVASTGGESSSASANPSSDPLAITLAHLVTLYTGHADDVQLWTTQIGFALSGLLFLVSISSVITTLKHLSKVFPWLNNASSVTQGSLNKAIVIAQLGGIYVISTSLLLRSNLPPAMSKAITIALGAPLDTSLVEVWFDLVFAIIGVFTAVGLYIAYTLNSEDDEILADKLE